MRVDTHATPVEEHTYSTWWTMGQGSGLLEHPSNFSCLHTLCDFNHSHSQCLLPVWFWRKGNPWQHYTHRPKAGKLLRLLCTSHPGTQTWSSLTFLCRSWKLNAVAFKTTKTHWREMKQRLWASLLLLNAASGHRFYFQMCALIYFGN